jgi:hypothetical protein
VFIFFFLKTAVRFNATNSRRYGKSRRSSLKEFVRLRLWREVYKKDAKVLLNGRFNNHHKLQNAQIHD